MAFNETDRTMLVDIYNTLFGKTDDRHDQGLIGDVAQNTRFRKVAYKFNWTLLVAFLTLIGLVIAQGM